MCDENILYLDRDATYVDICICKNILYGTLKFCAFCFMSNLSQFKKKEKLSSRKY